MCYEPKISSFQLLEDYYPLEEKRVESAIHVLKSALKDQKWNKEQLDPVMIICQTALNHYSNLNRDMQLQIDEVKTLFIKQLSNENLQQKIALFPEKKKLQNLFLKIFMEGINPSNTVSNLSVSQAERLSPLTTREKQEAYMQDVFSRLVNHYYPFIFLNQPSPNSNFLEQSVTAQLETLFKPLIPHCFFKDPEVLNQKSKTIVLCLLQEILLFFQEYSDTVSSIENKIKEKKIFEEQAKTKLINACYYLILTLIKGNKAENSHSEKWSSYFLASTLIPTLLEKVLTPYHLTLLIHGFLLNNLFFDEECLEEIPLNSCDSSDNVFSEEMGELIKSITETILEIGEANGPLKVSVHLLLRFKETIGSKLQQLLNQVLASQSIIMPFMLLDNLHYYIGEPYILNPNALSEEEKKEFMETTKKSVETRAYSLLEEYSNSIAVAIQKQLFNLEEFSKNISGKAFEITQNPILLTKLLTHLVRGLDTGIGIY